VNKDLWEEDSNGIKFQRLNIPIFVRSSDDDVDNDVKEQYAGLSSTTLSSSETAQRYKNDYFFFEGENKRIETEVTLPLSIWLKLAGVDSLDALNGPPYVTEVYPGTTTEFPPPRYRLTGVQIEVLAKFTNEGPRPGRNQFDNLAGKYMTCEFIVQALKTVPDGDTPPFAGFGPDIGGIGADMYGPNFPYDFVDSYKYGVDFQMEATGQLGTFDTQNFVLVLVTAFVSLTIAPIVAAFIAKYLLGAKSKIFRDIQEQSVEKRLQQQTAIMQLLRAKLAKGDLTEEEFNLFKNLGTLDETYEQMLNPEPAKRKSSIFGGKPAS